MSDKQGQKKKPYKKTIEGAGRDLSTWEYS